MGNLGYAIAFMAGIVVCILSDIVGKRDRKILGLCRSDYESWESLVDGLRSIPQTRLHLDSGRLEKEERPFLCLYRVDHNHELTSLLWIYVQNTNGKYGKPRIAVHRTSGDFYYENMEDFKLVLEREATYFQDIKSFKPSPCF